MPVRERVEDMGNVQAPGTWQLHRVTTRRLPAVLFGCMLLLLVWGVLTPSAFAAFGAASFDGSVTTDDPGVSYTQAGGHPSAVTILITFNTRNDPVLGNPWPEEPVKDVLVDSPVGLTGNPTVVAQCSLDELVLSSCPTSSQVGTTVTTHTVCPAPGFCIPLQLPAGVYSMVPPPGVPARFAFFVSGSVVTLDAQVRSGSDYGLSVNTRNVPEALPITATSVTLWGVPADPVHTPERHCPGQGNSVTGCEADAPSQAFLTMPTACTGPLTTTLHTDSWFHPGQFVDASFTSHATAAEGGGPIGVTGCDQVPFDGVSFVAKPVETKSPGPSGWTFDLTIPQDLITDPNAIAQSALKKIAVTLPQGVRVSPSSADGLAACSPAQIALHSTADPTCPDASKIASVKVETPLLDEPLTGAVYLATPFDNPTHSLVGIYLVAQGSGVTIKLPGSSSLDSSTGQLTATFDNSPQQPISKVHLEFFGGDRAALSNPSRCGTYTTKASLTSWSGKTVESDSSFTTTHDGHGAPCPAPRFKPEFSAGTTTANDLVPAGGSFSSFVLNLSRSDDDEELAAIKSVEMPNGLLARIASVPLCPAAKVTAGTCGEESRIGSVAAAAGPGPDPFAVDGRIYLGGPYKGAPFSLSIVVPAIAGPFDLGTIVTPAALDVDPYTAQAKIRTDPLPTILQGIPLQIRWISALVDRPKFFVNPTSCNPKRIGATVVSTAGTVAQLSSRFKVNDCAALPLSPRMRISVGSKGHTGHGANVPLTTTLTQPHGQAGLKSVSVTLPLTLTSRLEVINDSCTQAQFDAGHCESARAGSAVAVTPLLKRPLRGGAYFVKDPAKPAGSLPNLVIALRGQVAFNLVGTIKVPHGTLLSTRFTSVPDVPVSRFTLKLSGGRRASLAAAEDLCTARAKRQVATLSFRGQNGKVFEVNQRLKVNGCGHKRARR